MKVTKLLFAMLFLGVVACEGTVELGEDTEFAGFSGATSVGADGKADSLGQPSGAPNGQQLYVQHCGACHGADATGGNSFPRSIVGFTPIEQIVLEGEGVMPAIPITVDETASIQAFLLGSDGTDSQTEPTPTIDASSSGREVYQVECASCHGPDGAGAAQGPPIRLRDPALAQFTVRQGRNGAGNPSLMPVYDHSAVTDTQLNEMVAWLDAFPNPTDGEGLYNRYCSNCHGADGAGGPSFHAVAGTLRAQNIIRSGHGQGRFIERTEYMPAYTPDQISDEEITLIEQYMRAM